MTSYKLHNFRFRYRIDATINHDVEDEKKEKKKWLNAKREDNEDSENTTLNMILNITISQFFDIQSIT